MNKRPIHQLVHTLSYGDAISSEVLAMEKCLHSLGYESKIFALNEHPRYRGKTEKAEDLTKVSEADLVLHYSLGSPLNDLYAHWSKGRRALIYHNITPPEWFDCINDRVSRDIRHGIKELPGLCALSDLLLADSQFNADELGKLGFSAKVLDLPIDPERWHQERNAGLYRLLKSNPGIHLLHVGRLAPNKKVEDIIKLFYFLHHHIDNNSRLWLAGIDIDTELYSFSLKRLAVELRLDHAIEFVGALSDEEIRALYEGATVYVCMSEHEGFCLPVLEAMNFELPVVAYAAGAVPDTVGKGAVLVTEKRHAELAALVAEVAMNQSLRGRLVTAGRARVAELSYDNFAKNVAQIFDRAEWPKNGKTTAERIAS